MIVEFETLREDEQEVLFNAPILVALLIAGADGKIDDKERQEAIDVAQSKQLRARPELIEYYKVVAERFESKFNELINVYPADAAERIQAITLDLRRLNIIFPKISSKKFTIQLYASLKDIAKRIAESSGGVMGYLTVSYEEAKLLELKMINNPEA